MERASLTEALKTPGTGPEETEEPQGLALLRRMAESAPRQVHDLTALEALLGRRLRISPSWKNIIPAVTAISCNTF